MSKLTPAWVSWHWNDIPHIGESCTGTEIKDTYLEFECARCTAYHSENIIVKMQSVNPLTNIITTDISEISSRIREALGLSNTTSSAQIPTRSLHGVQCRIVEDHYTCRRRINMGDMRGGSILINQHDHGWFVHTRPYCGVVAPDMHG